MRLRSAPLVAALVAALMLSTTATAFAMSPLAQPVPLRAGQPVPARLAATLRDRLGLSAQLRPSPAAETLFRELPAGSSLSGRMGDEGGMWLFRTHAGQNMSFTLTGARGTGFAMILIDIGVASESENPDDFIMAVAEPADSNALSFQCQGDALYALAIVPTMNPGSYRMSWTITDPTTHTGRVSRVAGVNRIGTAIEMSKEWASSDAVVVATARNFADALAAASLCGSYGCPLLLTEPTALPAPVAAEIERLGATQVFVVGGESAVSASVYAALGSGGRTVERVAGENRYSTAAAIAAKVKAHEIAEGRTPATAAFVVNGMNFPDALSVTPYAYTRKMPILLVQPWAAPAVTTRQLTSLGITKAYVIGGAPAVQDRVVNSLPVASKQRVSGSDRLTTSIAAAQLADSQGWATWGNVGISTGWNYPDALAGGVRMGHKAEGVLLLTHPMYLNEPYNILLAQSATTTDAAIFGSTAAVSGCVLGDVDHALRGDRQPLPYHGD